MKNTLYYILLSINFARFSKKAVNKPIEKITSNSVIDSLKNINFTYYYGKPIDSLLSNKYIQLCQNRQVLEEPNLCFYTYMMSYREKESLISIAIYPKFPHKNLPYRLLNKEQHWDLELLKKEILERIDFIYLP